MIIFRCVLLGVLMAYGPDVLGQPTATYFGSPLQPPTAYYNANGFLALTPNRGYHSGEDWNGNGGKSSDYGDPVSAIADGKVVKIFNPVARHSWGKAVIIKHILPSGQIIYSLYAHLSKIVVTQGQVVEPYETVGNIGDANGYYKGAAHLHFEIRLVNDWTPASPGYYPTVTTAVARKYFDPSLFLDDRLGQVIISSPGLGLQTLSAEYLEITDETPASLAYVICREGTKSLSSAAAAGWLSPTAYVRPAGSRRWKSTPVGQLVFNPDVDFRIKFLKNCDFGLMTPGHNFPMARARQDMIDFAGRAGFTRVKLETLADLPSDPADPSYDFRVLCFDRGARTALACLAHATFTSKPLHRSIIWYDPATDSTIGKWFALGPNDIK